MTDIRCLLVVVALTAVAGAGPAAAQTADAASPSQSVTVEDIIARNLEARGGVEKLRTLETVRIAGIATPQIVGPPGTPRKMSVPITTWAKRPNLIRRDQQFPDRTVSIGFDGKMVWVHDPLLGPAQELTGPTADLMREDARFDPLFLTYQADGHRIELVGRETLDGVDVYHLRVTKKDGRIEHHYLRVDTALEFRTVAKVQQGPAEVELRTDLSDYRTVDGMQVAFGMQQFRDGQPLVQVSLKDVVFNVPIEDSVFSLPAGNGGRD